MYYKIAICNLFPLLQSCGNNNLKESGQYYFFFLPSFLTQYVDFWICDITPVWVQNNRDSDKADLSRDLVQ